MKKLSTKGRLRWTYRYFALRKDDVYGTGEIRRDRVDDFFDVVKQVSGMERIVAEEKLHSGAHIETDEFRIWAQPINPFIPVRII